MSHPYKRYKKQVSNLQSYVFFLPGCDMRELTCFFFPSAIKASESRYPPWHVQPKPKTKTFDLKIAWAEPSKRPHVMSNLEKIASNLAETVTHDCWRLLAVAHGCSRSLIFFVSIYIVAIIAENVPFEVLGPYFLGPLSICSRLLKLTIAHDLCACVDCLHLPINRLFDSVHARARGSSSANRRQNLELYCHMASRSRDDDVLGRKCHHGTALLHIPTCAVFSTLWPFMAMMWQSL